MTYWWVNQNQTWQYEIGGGFLWSPKCKRNGARNQFYENMRLVREGDTVFSYYNSLLQYIGVATGLATTAKKPVSQSRPARPVGLGRLACSSQLATTGPPQSAGNY